MSVTVPTSPLSIPDFRLYWISRFAAVLSTMGMVVIIGYQVYDTARADYGMAYAYLGPGPMDFYMTLGSSGLDDLQNRVHDIALNNLTMGFYAANSPAATP